ncbi:zinc finger protein 518A [Esox lucius]|uniref:C2H2-type domain-containing protein n=1 Tax=Esox lucius TaxID=8010 RepID=A0A3P8X773_ESOLU|nr:zinc finger protein 518A [Esox lucius]XP_010864056.1 zinc finger protein 518A [Esox lucius]XP_010864057.1 zinc finger protein 518A [Esox lucius]XP_019900297.1 zinc finger protein 518A [Esox lucius]XP_028975809.1 zinc finger protein 518A [Esox lucius]
MEQDLPTPDDPAESHDDIMETEDEKELAKNYTVQMADALPCSDQYDPDETSVEESVSHKTARKLPKKSPCKIQQGAVFSGKILSFGCSECKGDATYSPNDLLKHFQGAHKGTLPTYPCDLCGFVTNEFPALQRHRIGHRNTLVTCEICNDDVQYSLLLLTRHYIISHSQNGHFHCEKCEFSTVDAGTFVQHIHHHNENRLKCVKCQHLSSSRGEHQRHLKLHSGTFPFTCQVCGYGAARREYLTKHMVTVHGEDNTLTNSSSGLKLLLKKSPAAGSQSKESQWMSKLNSLPGVSLLDQNGRLLKPEKTLEETQQFLERAVGVQKDSKKWLKGALNNDQQLDSQVVSSLPPPKSQESDDRNGADALNPNGLTVLMVKNKISIPPNCTTKVMGFKMVDGKKHLVLKVIPTSKPEPSTENELCTEQDMGCPMIDNTSDDRKCSDSTENGAKSSISSSYLTILSPSGHDQDAAVSVQVKSEDEDISIEETLPILEKLAQKAKNTEQKSDEQHKFRDQQILSLAVSGMITQSEYSTFGNSQVSNHTTLIADLSDDSKLGDKVCTYLNPNVNDAKILTHKKVASETSYETKLSKPVSDEIINMHGVDLSTTSADKISPPITENSFLPNGEALPINDQPNVTSSEPVTDDTAPLADTVERTHSFISDIHPSHSTEDNINSCVAVKTTASSLGTMPQMESCLTKSDNDIEIDTNINQQNSSNQEVFNFHNYSKETSSISSSSTQPCEHTSEDETFWMKESPEWSLTLAESPEPPNEELGNQAETAEGMETAMERVSDSDIEVDECIATIEDLGTPVPTDENHGDTGSTHLVQPKVKLEEENVLLSERATGSISSSSDFGRILEEHSDAIISHQLEKDRIGCSTAIQDSVKPPKTMLRILKMAEGKQQMFLQTAENRYALPVHLQGNPGFKLITKSTAPQINVSYVQPGIELKNNTTGLALTLNDGRFSIPGQTVGASEKGTTLLSSVPHGAGTSHYLVNSTAIKGPLFLSGAAHGSPGEKTIKSQQTCYLVQRPVPVAQVPLNTGSRSASSVSQSLLMSRPVPATSAKSVNKSASLQTGRQAFLVRYISPVKSGMLLNTPDGKSVNQKGEPNENRGNKIVYKIVRTANGSTFLASGAPSANNPFYLATNSTQKPCFLMSSNNVSTGVKKLIPIKNATHKPVVASKLSNVFSLQSNGHDGVRQQASIEGLNKSPLAPRLSQRKRRRKALFDELPECLPKAKRISNKAVTEKGGPSLWEPVPKDAERTMRLYPFSSLQEIKCPRRNQPVVVLNHPDADIPEVVSIMKSVNKYKGAISKVALSPKTVEALSEIDPARLLGQRSKAKCPSSQSISSRLRPLESRVRERFLLKLKFRKTSRKKYKVVKSLSRGAENSSMFACWFCGRLFNNQEVWIGHGQRHLMEATRDWNKLF